MPYNILKSEKILAPSQDVETFIRHALGQHFFIVEKANLDDTNKRYHLHFWQRDIALDRYMDDGKIGKVYWGGSEIVEWSKSTEIVRMWAATPEDWYVGEFNLDRDKVMEERFGRLEELSNEIREKFELLSVEQTSINRAAFTKRQESNSRELSLKQLDSIVHNTLLVFQGFEIERKEEGSNIFYTIFTDVESKKVFLGKYRVWEWHDGSGRSGWMPSNDNSPEIEKLRHSVWQAIVSIAVDAINNRPASTEQNTASDTTAQKIKGGRPRNIDDDWAYEQVRAQGRDKQDVYAEWLEKIGPLKELLLNPKDSFNKAVSPKRGNRK